MATRVSASRWRTAWKVAMGWPNWIRSRACRRASSSMALEAPDQLVAEGQLGQGHRPRPGAGLEAARSGDGDVVAGHLDEAEAGVHALHRPERQIGRSATSTASGRSPAVGHHPDGGGVGQ